MRFVAVTLTALLVLVVGAADAAVLKQTVGFRASDFELEQRDDYVLVLGDGMDVTGEPGCPQLPAMPFSIEMPGRCVVKSVRIKAQGWGELASDALPFPSQPQVVLSLVDGVDGFTGPDPVVYESGKAYPAEAGRWTGTGRRGANTVVDLVFHPVRFTGDAGLLEFCSGFRVEVDYEPLPPFPSLDISAFDYVIVTSSTYDSIFQRLADWKTKKGVPTVVRDIAWVYSTYPGRDNAEKLRNYTKTLPDSGVVFLLLGGDVSVIPFRKAFAMESEGNIHNREDSLPCDLYFADADGDWDRNGNNVFGEVADSVDMYPDLYAGRAPVNSRSKAQAFVNKVLEYEKTPAMDAQDNVLFFAEVMWSDPYTDGGKHKDMLERKSFSSGYTVTKKYERLGNESRSSVMAAIRDGQNYMNHDGHGWIDVMSCGGYSRLRTRDADTITNAYRGIMFSIGCWTAAYDYNSIGEAFVSNANGGAVAFVGNSSYGWGSPGNSGFGYSDKFDDQFWGEIQNRGYTRVGEALALSKAYFVPFSRGENVYRWHQYQLNLMGCPEMPVWTAVPESLTVVAPEAIPMGAGQVQVMVSYNGSAVPGALVCLMKGEESYSRGHTDAAGRVWLATDPQTAGSFTLTVTAQNFYPHETTVSTESGAFVNFAGWEVNDLPGNDDGIVNPAETIFLPVTMHNAGTVTSDAAELVLRCIEPCVELVDTIADLSQLAPGESLRLADAFEIDVLGGAADGQVLVFDLVVRAADGVDARTFHPVLLVGRTRLGVERYYWATPPALPGETKAVKVCVENLSHAYGHGVMAKLVSLDANVTVLAPDSISYGEIDPKSAKVASDSFRVSIAGGCPASYLARVELILTCEDYEFRDTFNLLIGNFGFSDDMESGDDLWTHGGSLDRWHLSTHRYHSSNHAWYCGESSTHRYNDNTNAWLKTDPFMVAENCSLKFWRWFSVPNYGVDGIYVVVLHDGGADTLDFIGTGGALGEGLDGIECDWYQEKYDLSWVPVGDTIEVKIGFKSDGDGDRGEGFYIDDFTVTGGIPPMTFITSDAATCKVLMRMSAAPTPFRNRVTVRLAAMPGHRAHGRIYDASGRAVRDFSVRADGDRAQWVWDGTGTDGRRLPAGAYFIEVRSDNETKMSKVLLTR